MTEYEKKGVEIVSSIDNRVRAKFMELGESTANKIVSDGIAAELTMREIDKLVEVIACTLGYIKENSSEGSCSAYDTVVLLKRDRDCKHE